MASIMGRTITLFVFGAAWITYDHQYPLDIAFNFHDSRSRQHKRRCWLGSRKKIEKTWKVP